MKKQLMVMVFGCLFIDLVWSAENDLWNYVEVSRLEVDPENSNEKARGFAIDAKYSIAREFYLNATYQQYDVNSVDINRYILGMGGKLTNNQSIFPYANIDYVYVNSDVGTNEITTKYWRVGPGLGGTINKIGFKLGLNYYRLISDEVDNENGYYAELYYAINNNLSAGINIESINDTGDLTNLSLRYHF